jgi:hypothetical protein
MELSQRQITAININITYQDEDIPVNFNRGDWEINLEIDFHKKPKLIKKELTLHKNLIKKYNIYKKQEIDSQIRETQLNYLKSLKKIK